MGNHHVSGKKSRNQWWIFPWFFVSLPGQVIRSLAHFRTEPMVQKWHNPPVIPTRQWKIKTRPVEAPSLSRLRPWGRQFPWSTAGVVARLVPFGGWMGWGWSRYVKVAGHVFSPPTSRNDAGNKMMRLGAWKIFGWRFSKKLWIGIFHWPFRLFPGDNLESQGFQFS